MGPIPAWGVAASVLGATYAASKLLTAQRQIRIIERDKAHALYDLHNQGKILSEKELHLVPLEEKTSPDNNSHTESLANARIAIAFSVLRSPYRVEGQKLHRITDVFLRTLCGISTGLASWAWIPLIYNNGMNCPVGRTQWLSLSILGIALGLNYLVRYQANIGTKNLQYYSEDRFSNAYQLAEKNSQYMLTAGDGRRLIWSNPQTGVDLLFDKDVPPQRAFEIVSSENSKFHELYLDLRSTFHGLGYSLQKIKGKKTFPFPDGPGRYGFLQIFLSKCPYQKKFFNWPQIENGAHRINGGVILTGDILLIDHSLEDSLLDKEYLIFLGTLDLMNMDTPKKLSEVLNYTLNRLKYNDGATNKVIRDKFWSTLPKHDAVGTYNIVLRLDYFITLGEGECRHRAALMGYLIERLVQEGHLTGKLTYLSNEDHAWVGFSCSNTNNTWELGKISSQIILEQNRNEL